MGDFPQYDQVERTSLTEETGSIEIGAGYLNWQPINHSNGFFNAWLGRWGHKLTAPGQGGMQDGPFGPPNRGGKRKSGGDGVARFEVKPVYLHNIAIWNKAPQEIKERLRINKANWEQP